MGKTSQISLGVVCLQFWDLSLIYLSIIYLFYENVGTTASTCGPRVHLVVTGHRMVPGMWKEPDEDWLNKVMHFQSPSPSKDRWVKRKGLFQRQWQRAHAVTIMLSHGHRRNEALADSWSEGSVWASLTASIGQCVGGTRRGRGGGWGILGGLRESHYLSQENSTKTKPPHPDLFVVYCESKTTSIEIVSGLNLCLHSNLICIRERVFFDMFTFHYLS